MHRPSLKVIASGHAMTKSQAAKQLYFDKNNLRKMRAFGGALLKKAKNRTSRPLSTKNPMHLVLRSNYKPALGGFLNKRNKIIVERALKQISLKYGVNVMQFAINSNHIHLLLKFGNRHTYASFIRSLTGTIALQISGATKNKGLAKKFWEYRPFTRIVESLRGFSIVKDYILLNQLEAFGAIAHQKDRLRDVPIDYLRRMAPIYS